MATGTITTREAVPSDAEAIVKIRSAAFNSPLSRWLGEVALPNKDSIIAQLATSIISGASQQYVACDETGQIFGYILFHPRRNFQQVHSGTWLSRLESRLYALEQSLRQLTSRFTHRAALAERQRRINVLVNCFEESQKRILKDVKDYLYINTLVVSPQAQGLGIGKILLQLALDAAKNQNLPCYLESSRPGYPFYLKKGFIDMQEKTSIEDGERYVDALPSLIWRGT